MKDPPPSATASASHELSKFPSHSTPIVGLLPLSTLLPLLSPPPPKISIETVRVKMAKNNKPKQHARRHSEASNASLEKVDSVPKSVESKVSRENSIC